MRITYIRNVDLMANRACSFLWNEAFDWIFISQEIIQFWFTVSWIVSPPCPYVLSFKLNVNFFKFTQTLLFVKIICIILNNQSLHYHVSSHIDGKQYVVSIKSKADGVSATMSKNFTSSKLNWQTSQTIESQDSRPMWWGSCICLGTNGNVQSALVIEHKRSGGMSLNTGNTSDNKLSSSLIDQLEKTGSVWPTENLGWTRCVKESTKERDTVIYA